jgi:hypothetical protein
MNPGLLAWRWEEKLRGRASGLDHVAEQYHDLHLYHSVADYSALLNVLLL